MDYPLDPRTVGEYLGHIVAHERRQRQDQRQLIELLIEAMGNVPVDERRDSVWYRKADKFLSKQKKIQTAHENRVFNEDNYRKANGTFNGVNITPEIAKENYADIVPTLGISMINDPEVEAKINKKEAELGEEMSEEEAAQHFGVKLAEKKAQKPFSTMSLEEISAWESKQDNSNDLYKIKARVANLARADGAALTPVGEMMVNTFVHVVKDLYDFAETIQDPETKINLIRRIRKHEGMPGNLINAAAGGVRQKQKETVITDGEQQ